jgi:aminoglycoside phosphotransferase (APT) family kinase protein
MLNEDPRLSSVDMAWSPYRMEEFFNRSVIPRLCPGKTVTAVAIEDMTYTPGSQCVILYAIRFGDLPGHPSQSVVVTFRGPDKLQKIYKRCSGEPQESSAQPTNGARVFLAEFGCVAELFPTDWKLPYLALALDAGEIESTLSRTGMPTTGATRAHREARVLQYRPHQRCVVRYELGSAEGEDSRAVIGKFYPRGPKAARAWHAQNALHAQAGAGIIIPKPLALKNDWNLVLMEFFPGTSMKELLEEGSTALGEAREATRLIARALATLHRINYESQEVRTLESQLGLFRDRSEALHLVAPSFAQRVDALLDRVGTLAHRLKDVRLSCIHGECKASQFLMQDGQAVVVDFDRACLGDPAVDVGNFTAALHRAAVEGRPHCRGLASDFLAEYDERMPQDGLAERARLFQVASLARMAVRAFTRSPYAYGVAGADSLSGRLLQEAAECLAGL